MNAAHFHLIFNHIPLVGLGIAGVLLIIALLMRHKFMINLSLVFVIAVALFALPAYLTGEPAEEIVEGVPGISEQLIETHEEAAEKAFYFLEALGVLAILTLIARRFSAKTGNVLTLLTLLGIIAGGGLTAWTANLGGKINHPEIRSDTLESISSPDKYLRENENDD